MSAAVIGAAMNFYTVLGIPQDADGEMIRSAYKALARRYHPDRGSGSATEKFRQVNEAYETLIHSARRQQYDLALSSIKRPAPATYPQEDPRVYGIPRLSVNRIDVLFCEWFGSSEFQELNEWRKQIALRRSFLPLPCCASARLISLIVRAKDTAIP